MKLCQKCKVLLPLASFHKDSSRPDGVFCYCKSCNYKHSRKWAILNKEKYLSYLKNYRILSVDLEKKRQSARNWVKKNKASVNMATRKRRARKRGQENPTTQEFNDRIQECGNKCVYCLGKFEQFDHVKPVSKGGFDCIGNLVTSCQRCNYSKNNRDWKPWFQSQGFYSIEREMEVEKLIRYSNSVQMIFLNKKNKPFNVDGRNGSGV